MCQCGRIITQLSYSTNNIFQKATKKLRTTWHCLCKKTQLCFCRLLLAFTVLPLLTYLFLPPIPGMGDSPARSPPPSNSPHFRRPLFPSEKGEIREFGVCVLSYLLFPLLSSLCGRSSSSSSTIYRPFRRPMPRDGVHLISHILHIRKSSLLFYLNIMYSIELCKILNHILVNFLPPPYHLS